VGNHPGLPGDEAKALRLKAFEEHRTQAEILREGLRKILGLED
jgi:hypothetical protein